MLVAFERMRVPLLVPTSFLEVVMTLFVVAATMRMMMMMMMRQAITVYAKHRRTAAK